MNAGIDYGMGMTNIDHATGIRYGVLPSKTAPDWLESECESIYPEPCCPACGSEDLTEDEEDPGCMLCVQCGDSVPEDDTHAAEPLGFKYESDGVVMTRDSDSVDWFIVQSPFFTAGPFCSPCAPGAVYLGSTNGKKGVPGYCPPPTWWTNSGEKCPFSVYRVGTNRRVKPVKFRKSSVRRLRKYFGFYGMRHPWQANEQKIAGIRTQLADQVRRLEKIDNDNPPVATNRPHITDRLMERTIRRLRKKARRIIRRLSK